MKTISSRYKIISAMNKNAGNYINLSKAIRGMRFGKQFVTNAFNKNVPKSDYAPDERDMLLENLWHVSNSHDEPYKMA